MPQVAVQACLLRSASMRPRAHMPTHSSVSVYRVFMTLDCAIVKYFSTVDESQDDSFALPRGGTEISTLTTKLVFEMPISNTRGAH
jgi:hypothetical protein